MTTRYRARWLFGVGAIELLFAACSSKPPGMPDAPPSPNVRLSTRPYFNGEPTLAVNPTNPNNVVAAWMHSGAQRSMDIDYAYSTSSGATWTSPAAPFAHFDADFNSAADVSIAFDSTGAAHMLHIDFQSADPAPGQEFNIVKGQVLHRRSDDLGATWSTPVVVFDSLADSLDGDMPIDRPWFAVDRSGGVRNGWIYAIAVSFFDAPHTRSHIHLKHSEDGGETWSPDTLVDTPDFNLTNLDPTTFPLPFLGAVAVDGVGRLRIAYMSYWSTPCPHDPADNTHMCLLSATSTDGGQTFAYLKVADAYSAAARSFNPWQSLVAFGDGNAALFWTDGRADPTGSDIYMARVENGDSPWTAPVRLNEKAPSASYGVDQAWAVAEQGGLAVLWRDRRAAGQPGATQPFEMYFAYSSDGGRTFGANRRLSDVPSPQTTLPCCNSFVGVGLSPGMLHGDWGDFRNATTWNVYYGRTAVP